MHTKPGFTFPETLITGAVFALLILIGTLLLSMERARTRDAIRVGHMVQTAGAFAVLYAQEASYASAAAGCGQAGELVSACSFPAGAPSVADVKDPGRFQYRITTVPDTQNFGVEFRLERGYGSFRPGRHLLTKQGIQ